MKIALLGYGIEGESTYLYLKTLYPDAQFVIYDQAAQAKKQLPSGVVFKGGVSSFHNIDADMVVRTPAIRPDSITTRGEVTSATKLFFAACPAPIIGVTGSKGKGTTASLIASILRASGRKVHLVGNIGEPALAALDDITIDDVVVYELSSFQLWDMKASPQVAVVLMIEADHLDVHRDMDEYLAAKAQITAYQQADDTVVYNEENVYARAIGVASTADHKIPYPQPQFAHVEEEYFYYDKTKLCPVSALKLPGGHNQQNALAAIAAAWPWVKDGAVIAAGLSAFTGLPHRLKLVREVAQVRYYDDSNGTTPGSAIAALRAFSQPKVVILGGSAKGADFGELANEVKKASIRQVLLIGQEAARIGAALDAAGVTQYRILHDVTMSDIVHQAHEVAQPNDVVILSPACASFGMFKNYQDRGEQFIGAVNKL